MKSKNIVKKVNICGCKNASVCVLEIRKGGFSLLKRCGARKTQRAFSLVEILCVVALFSVLMGAALPALLNSQRSATLTWGGNLMADISTYARQAALSKNTATAVILVDKGNASEKQAVTVIEYDSVLQSWKQNNAWNFLPEAVKATDSTPDKSNLLAIAPAAIKFNSRDITGYSAIVFFPDGRMDNPAGDARQIRVGFVESNPSENYYNLVFSSDTSSFRILRPE